MNLLSEMMDFVLNMRDSVLKMRDRIRNDGCLLKMMDFVFKMMDFVLNMMDCVLKRCFLSPGRRCSIDVFIFFNDFIMWFDLLEKWKNVDIAARFRAQCCVLWHKTVLTMIFVLQMMNFALKI